MLSSIGNDRRFLFSFFPNRFPSSVYEKAGNLSLRKSPVIPFVWAFDIHGFCAVKTHSVRVISQRIYLFFSVFNMHLTPRGDVFRQKVQFICFSLCRRLRSNGRDGEWLFNDACQCVHNKTFKPFRRSRQRGINRVNVKTHGTVHGPSV